MYMIINSESSSELKEKPLLAKRKFTELGLLNEVEVEN